MPCPQLYAEGSVESGAASGPSVTTVFLLAPRTFGSWVGQGSPLGGPQPSPPLTCCDPRQRSFHGVLKHTHLFPIVLEAGRPKVKVLADSVAGEGPLPGVQKDTS